MSHCRAPDNEEEEGWCGEDRRLKCGICEILFDFGDFRECQKKYFEICVLLGGIVGLVT